MSVKKHASFDIQPIAPFDLSICSVLLSSKQDTHLIPSGYLLENYASRNLRYVIRIVHASKSTTL